MARSSELASCTTPQDAVFLNCGHGGMCFACASRFCHSSSQAGGRANALRCPLCREVISQIVQLADGSGEVVDGVQVVAVR